MADFISAVKEVFSSPRALIISIIGVFIYTLGLNLFLTPMNLFPIGLMGFVYEFTYATEIATAVSLSPDIVYFIFNIPILIIGYKYVGKRFTVRTLIVVALTSIFLGLIPQVAVIDDVLLSVIASAVIQGIGVALLLNSGASSGGTDIIALFFSIQKGKSFGTFNFIFNSIVVVFAVILTGDLTTAIYMLILIFVMGVTVDKIHTINERYTMIIVTQNAMSVKRELFDNGVTRGITVIESHGGYTGKANTTLLITCEKNEYPTLTNLIRKVDEHAFISTFKTQDVIGYFESTYVKTL